MNDGDMRAALRALWDCGSASAPWDHPGYRLLRHRGLVSFHAIKDGQQAAHRLNAKGREAARRLFECPPPTP